jgi:hypothetical protein
MNSSTVIIESWFIPIDIVMIVCTTLAAIVSTIFIFIIVVDKTCHTVPMMLVANSYVAALVSACGLLSLCIFTLQNDVKQVYYQDSNCVFRAYFDDVTSVLLTYSFLLQASYRYVTVVYPSRLFWLSAKFQGLVICGILIFAFIYPFVFIFNGEIVYNVDNQICQLPFRFSFSIIYAALCIYIIPVSMIIFIYLKLILHVKQMSKRVTPVNTLSRAKRELKMVQRTVKLITILITIGFPYSLFIFMSFFYSAPKYDFRIAFLFVDVSLLFVIIAIFMFTDPLKASVMKRINVRPNIVVAIVA